MNKYTAYKIAGVIIPAALLLGLAGTAAAQTSTTSSTKGKASIPTIITKDDTAITKRLTDLATLETNLNAMVHVSAATKASLSASIQSTVTTLTNLKTKIDADTDLTTLKTDTKSITGGTRVYALVVPQVRILAAADRASTIADMITAVNVQLGARITTAQAAGSDVTALTTAQADMEAKLADANMQSSSAISGVSGLVPDNGDATVMASNTAALKSARTDLQTAETDLKAANADMKTIISGLKSLGTSATSTNTTDDTSAGTNAGSTATATQ